MQTDRDDPLLRAAARIFRPVVRLLIARGVTFPRLAERLRALFVTVAAEEFSIDGRRLTDSRLSLLTGLQRREVKALRLEEKAPAAGAGPLARVLARWGGDEDFLDPSGRPRPLSRMGEPAPGFDALVARISQDIHPRTVLDELLRLGLVTLEGDLVAPAAEAFLPARDEAALLGYFGANLGDHAEAAAANVLAAPEPGPFFERAVHYNRLDPAALEELDALARSLGARALAELNARALALQAAAPAGASGRFRAGLFVFTDQGEAMEKGMKDVRGRDRGPRS